MVHARGQPLPQKGPCAIRLLATTALPGRIVDEMQAGSSADTPTGELGDKALIRLHQLLHEVKFPDPSGDHLSPAGEYNLRLGILKEFGPDLVSTHQGEPRVHDGHAFLVEAGVSLGGKNVKPGINIHRFANRIPLLFEVPTGPGAWLARGGSWARGACAWLPGMGVPISCLCSEKTRARMCLTPPRRPTQGGSDVITRTALKRINWPTYKINPSTDRVGVFVSIVSTKIPFKGAGKEYIGACGGGLGW